MPEALSSIHARANHVLGAAVAEAVAWVTIAGLPERACAVASVMGGSRSLMADTSAHGATPTTDDGTSGTAGGSSRARTW